MSATERLKQFTARINRLMDERDTLTSDIGDVYQEVKSAGFSGPALRKVIAALRMNESKRTEIEAMVEMYRAAVGLARPEAVEMLESGKTIRETNRATGVALGTLHRRSKTVPKAKTEHPIPEPPAGGQPPLAGPTQAVAAPPSAIPAGAPDKPDDGDGGIDPEYLADAARNYGEAIGAIRDTLVASGAARLHPAEIDITIPDVLRRA